MNLGSGSFKFLLVVPAIQTKVRLRPKALKSDSTWSCTVTGPHELIKTNSGRLRTDSNSPYIGLKGVDMDIFRLIEN